MVERMNKKEMIKIIAEHLDVFGFKPMGVGAGSIGLNKKYPTGRVEAINITYTAYPGVYYLRDYVSGDISFPEIEGFIEKYYKKYNLKYDIRTVYTVSSTKDIDNIPLFSTSDIPKFIPYLREMVYEDIVPFFEKYQTVEQVYEEMERLGEDFKHMNKFIFSPMPIRRMIIKRLVNEPKWEVYADKIVKSYIKDSSGVYASTFAPFAQFLPELFAELQAMKL